LIGYLSLIDVLLTMYNNHQAQVEEDLKRRMGKDLKKEEL